jgi:hypothetical protein
MFLKNRDHVKTKVKPSSSQLEGFAFVLTVRIEQLLIL